MDVRVGVDNLSLDWALNIADALFNDAIFEEVLINQMWLSAHWSESLKNAWKYFTTLTLWTWRSSKRIILLLITTVTRGEGCYTNAFFISAFQRGAGRVSVSGGQPDRLSAILGMPATSCNNVEGVTVHGPVLPAVADQWNQGPGDTHTHTHLHKISTPSHEHIQQMENKSHCQQL